MGEESISRSPISFRKRATSTLGVVLLSGGLDSSTTLVIAQRDCSDVDALTFSYGQRHDREGMAAKAVAEALGVRKHKVLVLDLGQIGGSALTDEDIEIPEGRSLEEIARGIPVPYVPARNTILLSYALAWAWGRRQGQSTSGGTFLTVLDILTAVLNSTGRSAMWRVLARNGEWRGTLWISDIP